MRNAPSDTMHASSQLHANIRAAARARGDACAPLAAPPRLRRLSRAPYATYGHYDAGGRDLGRPRSSVASVSGLALARSYVVDIRAWIGYAGIHTYCTVAARTAR